MCRRCATWSSPSVSVSAFPGVAVAIIVDGEVALADGFGVRDIVDGRAGDEPDVVPDRFGHEVLHGRHAVRARRRGSSTSTLRSASTSRGSRCTTRSRPSRSAAATCSATDRTPEARHGLVRGESRSLWRDVVRSLRHSPFQPLRPTWQYNNLGFSTAGYLTEVLTGAPWEEAVRSMLLDPLGMTATKFSAHDVAEATSLSPTAKSVTGRLVRQVLPARTAARASRRPRRPRRRPGAMGPRSPQRRRTVGRGARPTAPAVDGRPRWDGAPDRLSRGYALGAMSRLPRTRTRTPRRQPRRLRVERGGCAERWNAAWWCSRTATTANCRTAGAARRST